MRVKVCEKFLKDQPACEGITGEAPKNDHRTPRYAGQSKRDEDE